MQRRRFLAAALGAPLISTLAHARTAPAPNGGTHRIATAVLGGARTINVALPPGYDDPGTRFPVLYLIDGGMQEDFLTLLGLLEAAVAAGDARPMILVGIEGVDRKHDLTHPSADAKDRELLPTSGGSLAYRRFLVEELKPWIAGRYRTDGRSAVIGESLAGLFILETFLKAPESFEAYVAASPSLWWSDQALARGAAEHLRQPGFAGRSLYLSIADEGTTMQAGVDKVVAALTAGPPQGLTWRYDPMPTEHHNTIYQPSTRAALKGLFR